MLNLGLGRSGNRALETFVREWEGKGYRASVQIGDDGTAHVRGNIDAPDRAGFGFTKADVTAMRKVLLKRGIRKSWDEVDALLCQAQYALDTLKVRERLARATIGTMSPKEPDAPKAPPNEKIYADRAEQQREKRRRRVARLRAAGICIVCGREYVEGRATCKPCGDRANAFHAARKKQPT